MIARRADENPYRRARFPAALRAAAFALAATLAAPAALAQSGGGLFETLTQGPRLRTTPGEPADWVKASRPQTVPDAAAVDVESRKPRRALLTPDQVRRKEAELDALRARHDRLSGRKPVRGKYRSAAAEPEQKETKKEVGCALTCAKTIGAIRRR
ncbi:MAG TPA: hypothetical protein VIL72_06360 [Beijerinckiaceae bacterium]|jgi:hypothetical protein